MVDRFKYCRSTALYWGRTQSLRSTQVNPLGSSEDSQYFNQDYEVWHLQIYRFLRKVDISESQFSPCLML